MKKINLINTLKKTFNRKQVKKKKKVKKVKKIKKVKKKSLKLQRKQK